MSGHAYTLAVLVDKSQQEHVERAQAFVNQLVRFARNGDKAIGRFTLFDYREPPSARDILLHWMIPHGMWIPWARYSFFLKPQDLSETVSAEWEPLMSKFHGILSDDSETSAKSILQTLQESNADPLPKHMPPLLNIQDCPPISIITLVHNRPKFVQNACLNLMLTDYPKNKIEWVVVDDSDPDQSASDKIIHFQHTFEGTVIYVPLVKQTSIGKKRNLGIRRAKHDILLMMDDDDHVPATAFRRRVAWLTKDKVPHDCAVCTTLPMYDLRTGQSGVNIPPLMLGLAKRCSEATLTFFRSFWITRNFPETNISEGEGFLAGRESDVVEIPPQQIIVAFQHGMNSSSRKFPEEGGKGCFWGFDKVYLQFIHGLIGVQIEEA